MPLSPENPHPSRPAERPLPAPATWHQDHALAAAAANQRLRHLFDCEWTRAQVINFHRQEKFLLLAFSESGYRQLGALVGNIAHHSRVDFASQYTTLFEQALTGTASVGSHFNALQHMYGFLKKTLAPVLLEQFQQTLDGFFQHTVPLGAVLGLFRDTLHDLPNNYLDNQTYLAAFPLHSHASPRQAGQEAMASTELVRDVRCYAQLGIHRTGTDTDRHTSRWLHDELQSFGLETDYLDWTVPQFFLDEAHVSLGDQVLDAFPCWLPRTTCEPLPQGPLVSWNETGSFAESVVFFQESSPLDNRQIHDLVQDAQQRSAQAIILVDGQTEGGITARNSAPPCLQQPMELPCVTISHQHLSALEDSARDGRTATLQIKGTHHANASTRNVLGTLVRGEPWIVVSTPMTGWFHCPVERGSGIALWLALARWTAQRDAPCSYLFVANSGHELGHQGAETTFASGRAPSPAVTNCWLHLGANLGASLSSDPSRYHAGPRLQVMASPGTTRSATATLDLLPGYELINNGFLGEAANVANHDYAALGLLHHPQALPWFHTPGDTMDQLDPVALTTIGRAIQATLLALESEIHHR